jgi:hypothetical protein
MQAAGSSLQLEVQRLRAELQQSQQAQQQAAAAAAVAAAAGAGMMGQAAAAGQARHGGSSRPKGPSPPEFSGSKQSLQGREVDAFLREMAKFFSYYSAEFPDDASRVRYATLFLKGAAAEWWDALDKVDGVEHDWDKFVECMRERYRPMVAAEVARKQIYSLRQTGTVSAWCDLFLKVLTSIDDMSDADQVYLFVQGLKRSEVANEVRKARPKTLHAAMLEAVRADAFYGGSRQSGFFGRLGGGPGIHASAEGAPMDVNAIDAADVPSLDVDEATGTQSIDSEDASHAGAFRLQEALSRVEALEHRLAAMTFQPNGAKKNGISSSSTAGRVPGLSAADVTKLRAEGKCFRCKKTGHLKRECPLLCGKPNFQ